MKRFTFKDRIVRNYLFVLLLAVVIPLMVGLCLLQFTIQFATSYSQESAFRQLKQTQEQVENHLLLLRRGAIRIAQNRDLLYLEHYDIKSPKDIYSIYQLATEIAQEVDGQDFCKGFYIYIDAVNLVLYDGNIYTAEEFFRIHVKHGQYESWRRKLTENYFDDCYVDVGELNNLTDQGIVEYRYSYPVGGKSRGTISFLVDKAVFVQENLEAQYQDDVIQLYIFADEDIVYQSGSVSIEKLVDYLVLPDGCTNVNLDGEKLLCKTSSAVGNLQYIFIDNGSSVFRNVNRMSMFTAFYTIAVLLVGGLYILSVVRKMSKRNRKIYRLLVGEESANKVLDWNMILDGLGELSSKRTSLELLTTVKNDMIKNKLLIELLYGNTESVEQLKKRLQEVEVVFNDPDYLMVLGTYSSTAEENPDLLKYAIQNILSDLLEDRVKWYFVDYNWNQIIFILRGSIGEKVKKEIENAYDMLAEFIQDIFNAELRFGIGEICHTIEEIRLSAHILLERYEYSILYKLEESAESGTGRKIGYEYLQKEENELISLVLSGAVEEVKQFLDRIIAAHKNTKPIVSRTLFYHLIGTLFKCAGQLNTIDMTEEIENELILCSQKSGNLEDVIKKIFIKVCERIAHTEEYGRINALGIKMLNYVDTKYHDVNLSLKTLSNEFGITVSYASKVFKERIGNNFSNYLTDKRIEKSRQLLAETNMSISEIALRVGYIDSSIFIKNFKKVMRMTPGKYREKHSKKN